MFILLLFNIGVQCETKLRKFVSICQETKKFLNYRRSILKFRVRGFLCYDKLLLLQKFELLGYEKSLQYFIKKKFVYFTHYTVCVHLFIYVFSCVF